MAMGPATQTLHYNRFKGEQRSKQKRAEAVHKC